ncbi:DUF6276 family protein [Natrialba asiatica]|uniref:Uncharacterized protein n=1 Tax=Natrialba asiatica (strain ATCC 700177 / DSM 12278 / JCM 9576 / FERM P-10747 / NBRC 102637 / 172P1) TaxID=29540 RepID=M0AZM8_NATA1|nr:DUF6276 family protein [Natrialba asiatica]ELZ03975.1 hypothetical protein C481_04376 [Natrialba asiatica DSM 12278]
MACPVCGSPTVAFAVPADYRFACSSADSSATAQSTGGGAADVDTDTGTGTDAATELVAEFCTHCLTLECPADGTDTGDADADTNTDTGTESEFAAISEAFPTRRSQAIPLALAIGLASSLATNRSAIETLLRDVERSGTDPLLVLDRLQRDPSVEPAIDLERRQHQLEQLLY